MSSTELARRVPYVDFAAQFAGERAELLRIVEDVFARGEFVGGTDVDLFERAISSYLNVPHVVAVNSGTDALILSLASLGIGRGDEVITAANSFIASAAAIAHVGAVAVFADVLPDHLIDPAAVESAITPRTRAIMPVHLAGRVADMVTLGAIASRHGLAIVEDAAQAFGSRLNGRCAGTFGTVNAFSAHPLKNFNAAGDAGFIVTADKASADRIRRLRNHGLIDRDTALEFGYVSRMDTLQAAILRYRLGHIDAVIAGRRKHAATYREVLASTPLTILDEAPQLFHSYHLFVVECDRRDALRIALRERGIATKIHYPTPIHLQPAARHLGYKLGSLPQTERQAARILSLPIHQFLEADDIAYVAKEIDVFFN